MPKIDGYALMRKIRQILDDRPADRFRRSLFPPMLEKLTSNRRSPLGFCLTYLNRPDQQR